MFFFNCILIYLFVCTYVLFVNVSICSNVFHLFACSFVGKLVNLSMHFMYLFITCIYFFIQLFILPI